VKPGEWFNLKTYYEWSTSKTGNIEVYLNDSKIMERQNVVTQFLLESLPYMPRQWTINTYGDKRSPNPITMYFDDAAISRVRLGSKTLSQSAVPEPTTLMLMGGGVAAMILTRASRRILAKDRSLR
jgi:PEP-CTERM motif-containing protein